MSEIKAGKLKHTANHIREAMGTEEELRALGASFVNRPVNPIICLPDLEVVDGNRRLAGVLLVAGPEAEVPVCITDERVDESARLEIMIQSAIHTRGLSAYEEYLGASQWMERNPGATAEDPENIRTTSMMDDCNARALTPLRKSSDGVQPPRSFFTMSPSASTSRGFLIVGTRVTAR